MHQPAPETSPIPRAPSQAVWNGLTAAERAAVVAGLPCYMTEAELSPPEGDHHANARSLARDTLRDHYQRIGRRAYVGSDLIVYYPDERRFAPDLFVVLDVEPGNRDAWIVSAEGKGLDFVLEVLYHGDRAKDLAENVRFYAQLGIPEYFVYDRARQRVHAWRLTEGRYLPILPQRGLHPSEVLGFGVAIEDGRLRFYLAEAVLPEPHELLARAQKVADQLMARLDEEERARAESERRLAEALALIEQLKADR